MSAGTKANDAGSITEKDNKSEECIGKNDFSNRNGYVILSAGKQ